MHRDTGVVVYLIGSDWWSAYCESLIYRDKVEADADAKLKPEFKVFQVETTIEPYDLSECI